jgi:hypothetical protein
MWPKRKGRNRRHGRDTVLEVKMRSRDARRARFRTIAAAIGAIGGTAVGALLIWQGYQWALLNFVYRNETYAIRRIDLRHEGRLRQEQIRRWADVSPGHNLLALDLDRVRHELELNPWIEWADVQAQRPDCLRLSVSEREPVARVVVWRFSVAEQRAWAETNYLDATGFVMPPLKLEWLKPGEDGDFSYLPRLVGLEQETVIPGETLRLAKVEAALRMIRAYEDSTLYTEVDLAEVDVGADFTLGGRLRQGTRLVFGMQDFDRQMRRWKSIQEYALAQGRVLEWLDLSVTNNLPARWQETTNAPLPSPLRKPKRPPKRHV